MAAAIEEGVRKASAEMGGMVEELAGRLEGVHRELKRSTEIIRQLKDELARRSEDLEDARRAADRWHSLVDRLRGDIQERKEQARRLRQEIRRKDREIEDLRLLVAERDQQLVSMEQELFRAGQAIADLESEAGPTGQRLEVMEEELRAERDKVRSLLNEMAYRAHAAQPDEVGTADVPEGELLSGLLRLSRNPDVNPARLVNYLSQRAGLLLPPAGRRAPRPSS